MNLLSELTRKLSEASNAGRAEVSRFQRTIADKERQAPEIVGAAIPLRESDANVDAFVDEARADWFRKNGHSLTVGEAGFCRYQRNSGMVVDFDSFAARCAFAPDEVKAELKQAVREAQRRLELKIGLPSEKRPDALAELVREIAALEVQEEAAVDELQAAGIQVEHRPKILRRRAVLANQASTRDQRRAKLLEVAEANRHYYSTHRTPVPMGTVGHEGWDVEVMLDGQDLEQLKRIE